MDMATENHLKMFFSSIIDGYNYNLKQLIQDEVDISPKDAKRIKDILDKAQNRHPNLNIAFDRFIGVIKK